MADSDVIVVGAGLAGLAATAELAEAGRKVLLLDQEPESSLGGQAHWSLGGLFLIGSPEQRRMGIRDSRKLAWQRQRGLRPGDRRPGRPGLLGSPRVRWPDSAAAECTATARWRVPSSAAACSLAVRRAAPPHAETAS